MDTGLNTGHCTVNRLHLGLSKPWRVSAAVCCFGNFRFGVRIDDRGALSADYPAAFDVASRRLQSDQPDFHAGRFRCADTSDAHRHTYGFSVFSGKVCAARG